MIVLRWLGTSAGELYPGIWCRCRNCEAARADGGPNLRQSACAVVGPAGPTPGAPPDADTLIDFPPEIVSQAWKWGVDLTRLATLFVTHSDGDHFLPYLLRWRGRPAQLSDAPEPVYSAPRFTALPTLHICGNSTVESRLRGELGADLSRYDLEFTRIRPFERFRAGDWEALPVAANHNWRTEETCNYILKREGITLFYGLDSDEPLPQTWEALSAHRFDLMIWEATFGFGDGGGHMNFARLIRTAERIRDAGLLAEGGTLMACHFSPHHCPPHDATAGYLRPHGIEAAFDGRIWSPQARQAAMPAPS